MAVPPWLIKKVAVEAIRNPGLVKKVILWIIGVAIALVFLPVILLNSLSSIVSSDTILDENFDLYTIPQYEMVEKIISETLEEYRVMMEQQAEKIRQENTTTHTDEYGNSYESSSVTIDVVINLVDYAYIFAYFSVKEKEIEGAEIKVFLHDIMEIQVDQNGDSYTIQNRVWTMSEIVDKYFDYDEDKEFFIASYESFFSLLSLAGQQGGGSTGDSSLLECHPKLMELANRLVEECAKQGYPIRITETVRTVQRQDELYAQGRTEPGNIVTNAPGSSYSSMHQWGVAFDVCRADGKGAYNQSGGYFDKVGVIGKSLGLEWGGDWKGIVDKPHFQLPDWGSSTSKLRKQYKTPEEFAKTWR